MKTKRLRVEFVGELASRFDASAWTRSGHAIHRAGMKSVKVHCVGMVASVAKVNANPVTLAGPERGPRDSSVICPCRKFNTRDHLNIFIVRNDLVFPQGLSV